MKKILGISLVAMMAVNAAHANIASEAYVSGITGALANLNDGITDDNLVAAINSVASSASGAYQTKISAGTDGNVVTYSGTEGQFGTPLTVTTTPTENSTNLITSGAVYTALAGKQDTIAANTYDTYGAASGVKTTIDAYTVNGETISSNPVLDGSDFVLTGYEKAATAAEVAATDTVNQAFGKVQKTLDGKQDAIAAGTYVETVTTSGSGNVVTAVSANNNGTVTATMGKAITSTDTINENGTHVLTMTRTGEGTDASPFVYTYQWELITRAQ